MLKAASKPATRKGPSNAGHQHGRVKSEILAEIGAEPDIMIWNNPTGVFFTAQGVPVKVGSAGAGDIIGLIRKRVRVSKVIGGNSFQPHQRERDEVIGMMFAIEVKTGEGAQRKDQKTWQAAFESFGGRYFVARSALDARLILKELRDI